MSPDRASFAPWLIREWVERFRQSAEAMSGESIQAEAATGKPDTGEGDLNWNQPFDAGPGAEVRVWAPQSSWLALGAKVLEAAGIDDAEPSDSRATFLEILQQSLSGVATVVGGLVGREVNCAPGQAVDQFSASEKGEFQWLRFQTDGGADLGTFGVLVPKSFGDLVCPGGGSNSPEGARDSTPGDRREGGSGSTAEGEPRGATATPQPPGPVVSGGDSGRRGSAQTIELLYDVELPVAVSFGRAHLPLKEVVKLTSGSIVELNRAVAEPVELIVNNCVIARAEVVVVDGNYGVRILEIVSQRERLRTLH
ncbi:MAG: flagellar motor switch protein FliN [Bryobacteraceae bacterium]